MSGPLRVGIVGSGWGLRSQLPAFRAAGANVSAVFSRSQERAEALAKEHNIPHAFSSVEELANCPEVDMVSVVCPAHERCRHVLAALAAGKSVLADKPFGLNASEADQMLVAASKLPAGRVALLDFELRCVPAVRRAREIIAEGSLGVLNFVNCTGLISMPFLAEGAEHTHWSEKETGGGMFSAIGTHFVDVLRHVLQTEVVRVSAFEAPLVHRDPPVTSDGLTTVNLITTGGIPVHMMLNGKNCGQPREVRFRVAGSKGILEVDIATASLKVWGSDGKSEPVEEIVGSGDGFFAVGTPELAKRLQIVHQLGNTDIGDLGTFYDGAVNQRVVDAVHASAAEGSKWVEVAPMP